MDKTDLFYGTLGMISRRKEQNESTTCKEFQVVK